MQQLWPDRDEDPSALVHDLAARPAWVATNFVSSVDGAIAVDGRSGSLGGPGDRLLFRTLRDRADVVLVGAGTVRAEDYGPTSDRAATQRIANGQADRPTLVVVTRSGDLLDLQRLWQDPLAPIVVAAGHDLDPAVRAGLADRGAEVMATGDGHGPDLGEVVATLQQQGLGRVLCEGGPHLVADMLDAGLVTDMFTTVAPMLVGGGPGMVTARLSRPADLVLRAVRHDGDEVLLHHQVGTAGTT